MKLRLPLLMTLLCALATAQVLSRPQTSSATGKLAPDFSLNDHNGKSFRLSSLRGQPVLLVFYRGSW